MCNSTIGFGSIKSLRTYNVKNLTIIIIKRVVVPCHLLNKRTIFVTDGNRTPRREVQLLKRENNLPVMQVFCLKSPFLKQFCKFTVAKEELF